MSILDMSDALSDFTQDVTFTDNSTFTVDFEEFENCTDVTIPAVIQPAQKEDLNISNVDWSKQYILIHSTQPLKINYFITWNNTQFKIINLGNYTDYCYFEAVGEEVKGD